MRRLFFSLAICLLAACGDDASSSPDAAVPDARMSDAAPPDAQPPDAAPGPVSSCLDAPTDLPRPPTDRLPCDLLPPGL